MTTITWPAAATCITSEARAEMPITYTYDPADPWAVSVTFHTVTEGADVTWLLSRDRLYAAVEAQAVTRDEDGDVILSTYAASIVLGLCSPDGAMVAQVNRALLRAFLQRTFGLVPRDSETFDADALIGRILEEAGA